MNGTPPLSGELIDWARTARYSLAESDGEGRTIVWSDPGGEVRYFLSRRDDGWYLLSRSSRAGGEQFELAASALDVAERHLFGVFGNVVRDEQGLPFLLKPWNTGDVAVGYSLSDISDDGYRVLSRDDLGPVAAARDKTMSLISLVPLSHLLELSLRQIKEAFLSMDGSPLMSGEGYAPAQLQ